MQLKSLSPTHFSHLHARLRASFYSVPLCMKCDIKDCFHGDKSDLTQQWKRYESESCFCVCDAELWRRPRGDSDGRKMKNDKLLWRTDKKTMIPEYFLLQFPLRHDWISLESHSQLIITMWLNSDVLRFRCEVTKDEGFSFLLLLQSQQRKNAENRKLSPSMATMKTLVPVKVIKSPWKLIKFLFVALGLRNDGGAQSRVLLRPTDRERQECFETIFIAFSLLKWSLFIIQRYFENLSRNSLNSSWAFIVSLEGWGFDVGAASNSRLASSPSPPEA